MTSIPHRFGKLTELLAELDRQQRPGLGARIYYDNLVCPVGQKYRVLMDSSRAEYVSVLEDDDFIAPDFVARCSEALLQHPDYVGFPVAWTHNGMPGLPVEHSLRHPGWQNWPHILVRDIVQFNPIRREIAKRGILVKSNFWDRVWADSVRAAGLCRTEVWIDKPMHYYRTSSEDTFLTPRVPWDEDKIPPLPRYPWLTEVGG